jgi:hypothetical protein
MALYSRAQLEIDLADVDRLEQLISAAVAIGEPDYFFDAAGGWLIRQPKAEPRDPRNWAYKQLTSLLAIQGQLFWTRTAAVWCDNQRRRLRMKLLNVGMIMDNLESAKKNLNAAIEHREDERKPKEWVDKAWRVVRANSIYPSKSEIDGSDADENGPQMALESPRTHEIDLDDPEAQADLKIAHKRQYRVVYRPNGQNIAVVYAS